MPQKNQSIPKELNVEQSKALKLVLNMIIPPCDDPRMPGASEVNFTAYIHSENIFEWIQEGLLHISEESQNKYGQEFSVLKSTEQSTFIDSMRRKYRQFFNRLNKEIIQCYYQDSVVMKAIGLGDRPPFPDGYTIEDGDLLQLEPVYLRGKIYRD